ncbi:MAG: cupin domain-containing protein [Betaproteobacteria bacterium]|nr:cupin domain-containing protein [Betaproteobacteria bacterium]
MEIEAPVIDQLRRLESLDDLIAKIGERNMTPGWIRREKPILYPEMKSAFVPAHWRYDEAKAGMQAAGRLIGTDLAERRNFVMRNPIPGNDTATLRTLVCAYQSILPGEKARSHRHAPHALRVILESRGSFSIVDGDKHPMETGDIVLTPGWCWHGHGHDGDEQAYWFDGLDVPLNQLLEPMFFEEHPDHFEKVTKVSTHSPMRFLWADTLSALDTASADRDGYFGKTITLPAPTMPTIQLKVHAWAAKWRSRPYRHAANNVYVVMRGQGSTTVGDQKYDWQFGDTIAAPAWSRIEHHASEDSVIFSMSDEALMRWAHFYRFEALA